MFRSFITKFFFFFPTFLILTRFFFFRFLIQMESQNIFWKMLRMALKSRCRLLSCCVLSLLLLNRKLGLFSREEADDGLFESLFATMADTSADFTGVFRELAEVKNPC